MFFLFSLSFMAAPSHVLEEEDGCMRGAPADAPLDEEDAPWKRSAGAAGARVCRAGRAGPGHATPPGWWGDWPARRRPLAWLPS